MKIGVMNTSKEITDTLQEVLRDEGFETCAIYTYELKDEVKNFDWFVKENDPAVIVYDIAIPYEENYELFRKLIKRKSAEEISFVLTTTNKQALEKLVGNTKAYEILGKPYDLNKIVRAVKEAHKSNGKRKIIP